MRTLFLAILLAISISARAATLSVTNMIPYGAMIGTNGNPGTNNGTPVLLGYAYVSTPPAFSIQNGGMGSTNILSTNTLTGNIQIGMATNDFPLTTSTYNPSVTNGVTDTVQPTQIKVPIYGRVQIIVTNNISVGVWSVFLGP